MSNRISGLLLTSFCILVCGTSCVYVNEELGSGFIPSDQRYEVHTTEFPIRNITMKPVDDLSGYSSSRITVGAIKNEKGDISSRSSAVTIIPASKYNFGEGGKVTSFHFAIAKDTLSFINEGEKKIIQNINVYKLPKKLQQKDGFIGKSPILENKFTEADRITDGIPVYDGGDSLSFDFSNSWSTEFLASLQKMETSAYDSIGAFTEKVFPGIYMTIDDPVSTGGRINLFNLIIGADLKNQYLSGGYAKMHVAGAKFDGKEVSDTTFLFMYGASDFSITQAPTDYYSGETLTPQYALNLSKIKYAGGKEPEYDGKKIEIRGGGGPKPLIEARAIRNEVIARIQADGIDDPSRVIINKATIILPFDTDNDFENLSWFPNVLSPTCRFINKDDKELVSYAGITDLSSTSENQGKMNRSSFFYSPDISYHLQEILQLEEYSDSDEKIQKAYSEKDIWLLTMSEEVSATEQEGVSQYNQNLQYSMYYNNMYNYGYGYGGYGYGGYGGYGYNNYYNYFDMLNYASMMQGSQQEEATVTVELDRDRYFEGALRGPEAEAGNTGTLKPGDQGYYEALRLPYMKITYSVRGK